MHACDRLCLLSGLAVPASTTRLAPPPTNKSTNKGHATLAARFSFFLPSTRSLLLAHGSRLQCTHDQKSIVTCIGVCE
jgi:hypothetical protein